jgi:hypothetical protein
MTCEQVRELLGRYHDGELGAAERAVVAGHLNDCAACPAWLEAIGELGDLTRALSEPEPPANLWEKLSVVLGPVSAAPVRPARRRLRLWRVAALAALMLVCLATGWFAHGRLGWGNVPEGGGGTGDDVLPVEALVSAREGEPVSLQEAAHRVGFRVLGVSDLPEGCCMQGCCLCKAGCCDLVQCKFLCRGEPVLLVQGGSEHHVRYDHRPTVEMQVNGKPARLIQCDGCLACCWKAKGTVLTLIGPRELSQLSQLVASVDQRLESKP